MRPIDKGRFMVALEGAVEHLHSMELAHNDTNPSNIMVNAAGLPVLADFGSCRRIREKLGITRGTPSWTEGEMSEYHTFEPRHDIYAINKVGEWLGDPAF